MPFLGVYKRKAIREYLLECLHEGIKLVKKISCFCVLIGLKEMDWVEAHFRACIGKFRERRYFGLLDRPAEMLGMVGIVVELDSRMEAKSCLLFEVPEISISGNRIGEILFVILGGWEFG